MHTPSIRRRHPQTPCQLIAQRCKHRHRRPCARVYRIPPRVRAAPHTAHRLPGPLYIMSRHSHHGITCRCTAAPRHVQTSDRENESNAANRGAAWVWTSVPALLECNASNDVSSLNFGAGHTPRAERSLFARSEFSKRKQALCGPALRKPLRRFRF
jgi:hypothetical protein